MWSEPRNPERMTPFLLGIKTQWAKVPDWRFGQLICNFIREYGDPFYLEEEQFLEELQKFILKIKGNQNE